MPVAEETELRDLVSQILEDNGILSNIRAQLRANVFLALEQSADYKPSFVNNALKEHLTKAESALGLCLVREFLEYLQLDNTLAVFNTETHHGKDYEYKGRNNLSKDLHLQNFKDLEKKGPLLSTIIQIAQETLGSSNVPAPKNEEQEAGDFEATSHKSPKAHMPTNISYTDSTNASLDHSHNLLNQTFTTGTLVTSFGSPDVSLDKQSSQDGFQTLLSKNQEKKPQSGGSNGDTNFKESVGSSESRQGFESGDSKKIPSNEKPAHTTSTNPQTSLSNLPPLADLNTNKTHGSAPRSLIHDLLNDDHYEEDFSSGSSGAGEKDSRGKVGKTQVKKEADSGHERSSSKDVNSPVASVSEELEGDTNSATEDVNSVASADTLDSSISFVESKIADHIEEV